MALSQKILFILVLLSPFNNLWSQSEIPHEFLVQLKNDYSIQNLKDQALNDGIQISWVKLISQNLHIWNIGTIAEQNDQEAYVWMLENQNIVNVQFNHHLQYRNREPNDSLFSKQWQYINTGENFAVPDADIDIDQAWDSTTGGFTHYGDTIVVAVIDDGIDTNHPDFMDNIWVNYNEISNNGTDDDGNGYVDDYLGWNSYEGNDDIKDGTWGGEHGTSVNGIIGAKGNNHIGVSGINWNIKLLNVVGGGEEDEALAAYDYVYTMRKLYNETNGKKGAFIVVSNSSWGLDYVFASKAPLWCAFYDSLGKVGVLNVGATSNLNINVDQKGDMPSTCGSRYLIIATNTDDNDRKVNSAGYGPKNVDLGAPGEDVYTTELWSKGGYGYFGGTSASAPHVTGVVALLYAAACPNLLDLYKTRPDSVTRLMKSFLLDGTDQNNTLISKTVSGGRLNAYGAMKQVWSWCKWGSVEDLYPGKLMISRIYPNPGTDVLNIEVHDGKIEALQLVVYGSLGQVLSQHNFTSNYGKCICQIPIHSLSTGYYILQVKNSSGQAVYATSFIKK